MDEDVERVVCLRKQSQHWWVIQKHDGKEFRRESKGSYDAARTAELDLLKLGYKVES